METPTPTPTSKYEEERGVFTRLDQLSKDKEEQAQKDGNYIYMLDTDYDKIKADSNNDGKIDQSEYKSYIVKRTEDKPLLSKANYTEDTNINNNTTHNYYHFDVNFMIVIGIVCISAIICTYIKHRR